MSGTRKEHKPKLLDPDIFRWGRGLPHEGVGAKKFGVSLETREIKLFWRDKPGSYYVGSTVTLFLSRTKKSKFDISVVFGCVCVLSVPELTLCDPELESTQAILSSPDMQEVELSRTFVRMATHPLRGKRQSLEGRLGQQIA